MRCLLLLGILGVAALLPGPAQPCRAAEEPSRDAALQKAWQTAGQLSDESSEAGVKVFALGEPGVDEFLAKKLGTIHMTRVAWGDMLAMQRIMKANKEAGCIWLLAQYRLQPDDGRLYVFRVGQTCEGYQEFYQFWAGSLTDPEGSFGRGHMRFCDLACEAFRRVLEDAKIALPPPDAPNEPEDDANGPPFAGEDRDINQVYKAIQTDAFRKLVAARPSALRVVAKSGKRDAEVRTVQLMLSRCSPRIVDLPGVAAPASLTELLQNEASRLSDRELARRKELALSTSDFEHYLEFANVDLLDRGVVQWALLARPDRMKVAKALAANGKRRPVGKFESRNCNEERQGPVVEMAGELLKTWGNQDPAASRVLVDLFKDILDDPLASWPLKTRAKDALRPPPDKSKP